MEDPAKSPQSLRTCPKCKRPVEPYFKFCEACGASMPPLPVCRSCGAIVTTRTDYCEVCGAPLFADEAPETDEGTAPVIEDAGIHARGTTEETHPEAVVTHKPGTYDESEAADETPSFAGATRQKRQYSREIIEPDTEEILEKFGDGEFGPPPAEKNGSGYRPGSMPALPGEPGARGEAPAADGGDGRGLVDSALFLLDRKLPAKARDMAGSRTKMAAGGIVILIILAIVFFIHIPLLSGSNGSATPVTQAPAVTTLPLTPAPVTTTYIHLTTRPTTTPSGLVTLPTQAIPSDQKVYFQVQKNPITSRITVIFAGSSGSDGIQSAEVTVTHPTGAVASGIILPLKGITEIVLDGSMETDRVEIIATMSTGEKYRVYDKLLPSMSY